MTSGRAENWGMEEKDMLIDLCCQKQLAQMTATFWDNVVEQVNAVGTTTRNRGQVKKKWADIKSKVKKEAVTQAKESRMTGGGPGPKLLSSMEMKVMNSLAPCVVEGVEGGIDTFSDDISGGFVEADLEKENSKDTSLLVKCASKGKSGKEKSIVSAIGNSLVLILIWRFRTLRNKTTILIINLAVANLGISVFGFPMSASSNFAHGWQLGQVGCQWYGFTGMLFGIGNIGLLTSISLDRYMLTCRHSLFLQLSVCHYILLVCLVWGNAIFWATTPLIGWCWYALDASDTACMITWTGNTKLYTSYVLSIFATSFVIPSAVIVYCYVNTWRFIKSVGDGGRQENIEWTHEKQVAKMCAVSISLFLLAWTPYAVVSLWAAVGDPGTIPSLLLVAPTVFAKSSACYNPVLYALINKRFRLALRKLLGFGKTRRQKEEMRLHHLERLTT